MNILQTFNSDGVIEKFVGSVKTQRNPHFRGPGMIKCIIKTHPSHINLNIIRYSEDH